MTRFCLGDIQFRVLDAGSIWLDGGAMFGVVPRVLWERKRPPDERNRIRLAMNLLLIDDGKQKTLVDTGAGDKWDDKSRSIYRIDERSAEQILAPAGLGPEEIDVVVNTHLHFDHAGGNTKRDPDGNLRPVYPNARYVVQRGELETARLDHERIRASYLPENFEPLAEENGRLQLAEGAIVLGEHVRLRVAPGHTPHMQLVLVRTGEGTVAFLADLVPTTSHLPYAYTMAYDLEPMRTIATKKEVLPEAAAGGWRLVFEHDDQMPLATIEHASRGFDAVAWHPEA